LDHIRVDLRRILINGRNAREIYYFGFFVRPRGKIASPQIPKIGSESAALEDPSFHAKQLASMIGDPTANFACGRT
jgi:hypothetical protein